MNIVANVDSSFFFLLSSFFFFLLSSFFFLLSSFFFQCLDTTVFILTLGSVRRMFLGLSLFARPTINILV